MGQTYLSAIRRNRKHATPNLPGDLMLAQLIFSFLACIVIWKGSQGFRSCGLRLGFFADRDKPVPKGTGMIVGGIIIAIGLAILLFGLLLAPSLFPDL